MLIVLLRDRQKQFQKEKLMNYFKQSVMLRKTFNIQSKLTIPVMLKHAYMRF